MYLNIPGLQKTKNTLRSLPAYLTDKRMRNLAAKHGKSLEPNLFGTQDMKQAPQDTGMQIESEAKGGEFKDYDGEPREYTWSVNLELDRHSDDRELVVEEAKEAVRQTAPGYFVNLVTHAEHGHPEDYLYDALDSEFDGVKYEFVDQCGCGGYVTRVHVTG